MTPMEFTEAAIKLYGRKHWVRELAKALSVDVTTIRRMCKREHVEGPYEVAIRGLLQNKRANDILRRADRKAQKMLANFGSKRVTWKKGEKPRKGKKYDGIEDIHERGLAKPGVDYGSDSAGGDPSGAGAGASQATVPDGGGSVPDPLSEPAGGEGADGAERGA